MARFESRCAAAIYTLSETWVAAIVFVINGAAVLIHNNTRAFQFSLLTCFAGGLIMAAAAWGWSVGD